MDHRRIGPVEDLGAGDRAVGSDALNAHFLGEAALCRVTEEHHLAGLGVRLGMGGEGAAELVAVGLVAVLRSDRHQAGRIERVGRMRFLERQQLVAVPDDVGVGDGRVQRHDARIGEAGIAEGAGEALALLVLDLPLRRAHPAVLVGDVAILDVEGVDHAVAAEPVVRPARRELRVGAVAIERTAELLRHLAGDLKMAGIGLGVHRGVIAAQEGIVGRKGLGHGALLSLGRQRIVGRKIGEDVNGNAVYLSDAINTRRFPQEES